MTRTPWKMYPSAWNFPGRCSSEFCEMAKKLTLDFQAQLSTQTLEFFKKICSMLTSNLKEFFILDHVSI